MPAQTRLPHNVPTAVDPAHVLPESCLLSAIQREWDGLHVAYAHFPPGEWPLPPITGHLITLHLGQPVNTVRQRDGRTQQSVKVHGDIEIVPAGSPSFWAYESANEALGIMLDPAFVQQVALQAGQMSPDRLELPHHFGKRDPLITHLGLALFADLTAPEVGSRLFAESAAQRLAVHLLVRRAKLGFVSRRQVPAPEALARHRVPSVASLSVTPAAKRTQGGDGPQCESVKGLSPVMDVNCGCRRR